MGPIWIGRYIESVKQPNAKKSAEAELYARGEKPDALTGDANWKDMFLDMIWQMDMSDSCKPVLIKAIMRYAGERGRIEPEDIVSCFRSCYEGRRAAGLAAEKKNSIFTKGGYADKATERNVLASPFKRFEDMQILRRTKTLGIVQVDESV